MKIMEYTKRKVNKYFRNLGKIDLEKVDIKKIEEIYGLQPTRNMKELEAILHLHILDKDINSIVWYNEVIENDVSELNIQGYFQGQIRLWN